MKEQEEEEEMKEGIMKELIGTLPSGSETLNRYDTQENR